MAAPTVSSRFTLIHPRLLAILAGAALFCAVSTALAQSVPLGSASPFGVIGASAITNTGPSVVTGDLGISPNNASSVTGFPPGQVIGTTHFADAVALQAQLDVTTAYNALAGLACDTVVTADLGGTTLTPGVYCAAVAMGLTGTLTLDAQGDPNALFVFQIGSTLTTGSASMVRIINGGSDCNVYWQVGSSATLGTGTNFVGNILALASITLTTGSNTSGRLLARTGAVTLDGSSVTVCAEPAVQPSLFKAFNPTSINAGDVSTLTITLSNPNPSVATLSSALVDTLPNGVVVATLPNVSTTCGGSGAPIANAGGASVSLPAGRSIPANGSCTLIVDVTAAASGVYINTLAADALVTSNGNNPSPAVATLTVNAVLQAMTLAKAFNPSTINPGNVSTLTITLGNPNPSIATLSNALVDTLPNGVVVAPLPNVSTTCGGVGSPLALAGGLSVTLPAGRTIPADGQCILTVDVTAAMTGTYVNTLAAGALATNNGNNVLPAVATLTVVAVLQAPSLAKSFNPSTINENGISTLTVTLSNPNPAVATLTTALVDTLPNGVVIAPLPNASTTCGGVGAPVAMPGAFTVTLPAGRTIPANGSCTLRVDVTAALAGSYINTLAAGALVTSNGNNPSPAIATLSVVGLLPPPTLGKGFNPSTINENGVSTLTITLSNPNPAIATLTIALVDTLPNGVVVAALPNVSTTCGGVGAPQALAGGTTVTLPAGRAIPANGSCALSVDVTAALAGTYINTLAAGALVTSNGNNPSPAVATLVVLPPGPAAPVISKSFTPSTINAGNFSTLTITLSNPNPAVAALLEPLIDTLPNGVLVAAIPNLSTTCGGVGELIAITGTWTVTVPAGRTIPANGSCVVTVDVTAILGGTYVNIIVTGALVTSNGNNPGPAIATLTVISDIPPPTLGKSFDPSTIQAGGVSTLTITLSNSSTLVAVLTAALVDTLPSGVVVAPIPNVSTSCNGGGSPVAFAGGSTLTLPAGNSIPANGNCSLSVDVTAGDPGSYVNILAIGSLVTTIGVNPGPAIATLTVIDIAPPIPTATAVRVPTLSTLGLLLLSAGLVLIGLLSVRQTR